MEDYLKNIYLIEKESKVARVSEISRRLNVKKASVVAAVRLLMKNNLLTHERYGFITLTPQGKIDAEKLIKKHGVIERFLIKVLKISAEKAAAEACAAEHIFGDETISRLSGVKPPQDNKKPAEKKKQAPPKSRGKKKKQAR
jgi:DtxR family transcriptional regulator, Mn-dependent transcriptional regulator